MNESTVQGGISITDQAVAAAKEGLAAEVRVNRELLLRGTILDYSSGLNGKGFVFTNPNATGTCGCGESFSV